MYMYIGCPRIQARLEFRWRRKGARIIRNGKNNSSLSIFKKVFRIRLCSADVYVYILYIGCPRIQTRLEFRGKFITVENY